MYRIQRRDLLLTGAAAMLYPTEICAAGADRSTAAPSDKPAMGVQWIRLRNGQRVWTQRVGNGPVKLLLLHGGPGFSHDYLECFASYLPQAGYEIYFYDQLGCGKSDRPDDKRLWTLQRYVEEVEEVRAGLGLDSMILFGHSWGGLLGIEYALHYPDRLQAFVLSNMTASCADFVAYVPKLKSQLPAAVRHRMAALERAGMIQGEEYEQLLMKEVYPRYLCRSTPWPEPLQRSLGLLNQTIYNQMQGSNEFVVTGNLRPWDRWARLNEIHVPTLVMGAVHDEINPASVLRESRLIPNAKVFMSATGSHLAMWDDQAAYFKALLTFLDSLQLNRVA